MKKTDLLEIRVNQTINIGLKVFLSDKIYESHLFKLHFGLSSDLDRFGDESERETRREKDRGIKTERLEDLKVLRRSPDLLNNAKIGQGQLQLILFTIYGGCSHFGQVT